MVPFEFIGAQCPLFAFEAFAVPALLRESYRMEVQLVPRIRRLGLRWSERSLGAPSLQSAPTGIRSLRGLPAISNIPQLGFCSRYLHMQVS